jgi:hypothetical protein
MKLAFVRGGAQIRHALQNPASFFAKRLILVEQLEKNALNKEIRRRTASAGRPQRLVN